jgi:primary-amine oxidase
LGSRFLCLLLGLSALAVQAASGIPSAVAHPLDPLTSEEIDTTVATLRDVGDVDPTTRFSLIDLDEPAKADVLAWKSGPSFSRKAFVIARRDHTVYAGVVDLGARRIERWQALPNIQSAILGDEMREAQQITIADAEWRAAMRKRGYDTFDALFCTPLPSGYFADPTEERRRLVKVTCFDTTGAFVDLWSRPIEGLVAVVDLDARKVIRIIDTGVVPIKGPQIRSAAGSQPTPKRTPATSPVNAAFTLSGNEVHWLGWSFHYRMDRRVGVILSLVRYDDGGRDRMVLYRGSLGEMFVPYMDPDKGWSFRTPLDVGEFGLGLLSSPLTPGIDCPSDAAFLDAILPSDRGEPVLGKSVICLFERDTGTPLWRHFETVTGAYQGRAARELVVRTIPSVGNYDYIIDWVLTEAGVLRIDVGATGIDQAKGVRARSMGDPSAPADTAYGTLVAPNLVGVNHDHFLSLRLDVDIDGRANTLVRERLAPVTSPDPSGRRSLWRVVRESVSEEGALTYDGHGNDEVWRIVNPSKTNALGQHPGYELRAGHSAISLLTPDDFPQRRAAFSAAPLWVTAYDRDELYAAGLFPNQSKGGDGLPAYAARHRPVENADIVLWYTMGFHHLPRPEDWPVLPTMWHSVSLVPDGFFERNPTFDAEPGAPAGQPK